MMKYLIVFFLFSISNSVAQQVEIKDAQARVSFLFLDDDVDGSLSDFKFTGNLNLSDLENSSISGTVASETIDTDNWLRNRHLRNKYFKTDDFPTIRFRSNSILKVQNAYIVNGNLSIKGISKPVRFRFTANKNVLIGQATINASDFNIMIHDEVNRNKVEITITLPYSAK